MIGDVEMAAMNVNVAILEVLFRFLHGMADGTAVRVGFHIGSGTNLNA
jgi:Na+-driven multidrug efflux pump